MKHYKSVEILSIFRVSSPHAEMQSPPHGKLSGDGSVLRIVGSTISFVGSGQCIIVAATLKCNPTPFNAHQSQYVGYRFFGYNSLATIVGELFKPSTDAGRLLGSIFKKIF